MNRDNKFASFSFYETSDVLDRTRAARALPLRKAASKVLLPRLKGSVLVLGWSSELQFLPPSAERIVVADFAPAILKGIPKRPNLSVVCAEASALPFDIGTFDVVLMPDVLHHMAEDFNEQTDTERKRILRSAADVLKREGSILIFEPLVGQFLETVNRILFAPVRAFMNTRNMGAPSYVALHSLRETIYDAGLTMASAEHVPVPGAYPIIPNYPDYTVPYSLLPIKFYLVEIKKKIF